MMGNPYPQGDYAEVHFYKRVSTDGQEVIRQDGILKKWMHLEGSAMTMEYYDHGFSAANTSRPEFIQMRGMLRVPRGNGYRRLIVCSELNRMFRSAEDGLQFMREHVASGHCDLFVASVPITYRGTAMFEDPMVYQQMMMLLMFDELERMWISKRTKDTLAAKKALGQTLGRPRDTSLDSEITDLHFQGKSAYAIAKELRISYKRAKKALSDLALNERSGNKKSE